MEIEEIVEYIHILYIYIWKCVGGPLFGGSGSRLCNGFLAIIRCILPPTFQWTWCHSFISLFSKGHYLLKNSHVEILTFLFFPIFVVWWLKFEPAVSVWNFSEARLFFYLYCFNLDWVRLFYPLIVGVLNIIIYFSIFIFIFLFLVVNYCPHWFENGNKIYIIWDLATHRLKPLSEFWTRPVLFDNRMASKIKDPDVVVGERELWLNRFLRDQTHKNIYKIHRNNKSSEANYSTRPTAFIYIQRKKERWKYVPGLTCKAKGLD